MRFLEAQRLAAQQKANTLESKPKKGKGEHKMQPGIRADQRNPGSVQGLTSVEGDTKRVIDIRPEALELADELGVNLETVKGTGKDGAILVRDIRAAATSKQPE